MGGVSNTINKGVQNTGKILSGKGNLGDVGNIVLGNTTFNKPAGWQPPPDPNDPFALNTPQAIADQQSIQDLGNQQYGDTLSAIDKNSADQQTYAGQTVQRMLPDIEETLNGQHLLNSSALPQTIGQQASYYAQDVASQRANAIQNALAGKQSFDTGSLQRGLSLEDFTQQAKVAKALGATVAPQVGNGKGTAVAGLGSGAAAGSSFGPYGALIGAGAGYLAGGGANGGKSK